MSELPRGFVPLPDIEQHTDQIRFLQLGLPIGFDEERLGVNLRAIDRIQRFASLGELYVKGYDGQASEMQVGIGNAGNGAATAAGTASVKKQHLAEGYAGTGERRPAALVKINTSEVQESIRQDGAFKRGPLDAAAQAKYLNQGLKEGLQQAAKDRLIKKEVLPSVLGMYAILEAVALVRQESPFGSIEAQVIAVAVVNAWNIFAENRSHREKSTIASVLYKMPLDRFALAHTATSASRLIKSRP